MKQIILLTNPLIYKRFINVSAKIDKKAFHAKEKRIMVVRYLCKGVFALV
jgi:hypothetical protein